jgi:hypothetical protein
MNESIILKFVNLFCARLLAGADEARTHFDWFARFVAIGNPASSDITRNSLGWRPQEPELLPHMKESEYFS